MGCTAATDSRLPSHHPSDASEQFPDIGAHYDWDSAREQDHGKHLYRWDSAKEQELNLQSEFDSVSLPENQLPSSTLQYDSSARPGCNWDTFADNIGYASAQVDHHAHEVSRGLM